MNRVTIFAHYDKNNLIQDYVIYYLKELKKVSDKIVFVSDCNISDNELFKISNIADFHIAKKHGEYDFGSYKRGYLYVKEKNWLKNCDELIFCNDSCYGPLFDIKDYFNEMSTRPVDFWGNTQNFIKNKNNIINEHIQSYFFVLKPQVFNSKCFEQFITSVKKETDKFDIVNNYEIGLTKILLENGYKYDVYCQISKEKFDSHTQNYEKLIKFDRNPFVKTSIYRYKNLDTPKYPSYRIIINHSNYDINLIKKDVKFNEQQVSILKKAFVLLKIFRKQIIKIHFKEKQIILMGKDYKFL